MLFHVEECGLALSRCGIASASRNSAGNKTVKTVAHGPGDEDAYDLLISNPEVLKDETVSVYFLEVTMLKLADLLAFRLR